VIEDYPTPNLLFETTDSWADHMRKEHSFSEWICTSITHEEDLLFNSEQDFKTHMREDHEDTFDELELPLITESSAVRLSWIKTLPLCPLCEHIPKQLDEDTLRYHIANRLRLLAIIPFLGLYVKDRDNLDSTTSRLTYFSSEQEDSLRDPDS
jgi:hypothetical protein